MREICVVQHTEGEFLGLMEDHFESRAIRFTYHRPFVAGGGLPTEPGGASALILLGAGPFGMVSGNLLPSMGAELRLTERFLAAGLPVIGTGLGSAILAVAAGGGVQAAPLRFVVGSARRLVDDALGGYLPEQYPLVRYGRDRALPPPGATILAEDEEGAPALFQVGTAALGFSGHPGMKRAMVEDLVMEFDESPDGLSEGLAALGLAQRALADALSRTMVGLVGFAGLMPAP